MVISFKFKQVCFVCVILFCSWVYAGQVLGQTRYVIKGIVKDRLDQTPLSGVSVKIDNTVIGTVTNVRGEFELNVSLVPASYTIRYALIGYAAYVDKVQLGSEATINREILLREDVSRMDEVVVTGTAVATSKRELGNAISSVNARDFENSAATSIDQALSGKISGAQITQNSGNPAGGISVRLRGTSTVVGSGDPLYIVDGVIINNNSTELLDLGGYAQNRLVDINPNDVERIEIIKGAAAAAIYGSRASNGVVQIFTKKGKEGKPVITFSTQLRTNTVRKTLPYNTYPYIFDNTAADDLSQTAVERYDFQSDIFRTGLGTESNVSVAGGTAQTQYYFSGSYMGNQGIIDQTNFKRGGVRLRIDQNLGNKIKVGIGANYVLSTSAEIPNGGMEEAYGALTGFIFSNNFVNPYPDPVTEIYPSTAPSSVVRRTNPLEAINRFDFGQRTGRFIGNFNIQATPVEGLSINYVLGYDNATQIGTGYIPVGNTTPTYDGGYSRRADQTTYLLNNDLNIAYEKQVNGWLKSSTGLGATYQVEKIYSTNLTATQLGLIGQTIDNGATIVASENRSDINIFGAFVQQTFGIRDKLFVTGALRYDESSVFGSEDRAQFYPKASVSYSLSDEAFWQNGSVLNVVSNFKVRASYGQAGNMSAIGAYARLSNYDPVSFSGQPGVVSPSLLGNLGIKPERQTEMEFGTDIGFFNDRLGLEFTYYNKDVKDLLFSVNLPPTSGYGSQLQNIGTMTNKGFELLLRGAPVQKENFTWNATATFSKNKNEVNDIPGGMLAFSGGFGQVAAVNGYPLGTFYSTYFARNEDGSLLLNAAGLPQTEQAGRNADGQPTGGNLSKVIGDPNPAWIASLINEFNVGKNLSFRAQLDASYGGDVFNFTRRVGERNLYGGLEGYEAELRGEVPKGTSAALWSIFENWIEDGSYVKLREVSVSYTLRPKFLGTGNMRLSLAGRNLFSIDDYSGYDPEINAAGQSNGVRGFDFVEVPIPRTFVLGVNMTF
ncbi:SusC/RagA family TonB-linked outer membrane protein [Olivibacter sitiensis]|uniref:SusC/RagA family TonB-linked outer membrane protein n=1 Tax=Olivibacter sitiensis TaxID=376470 RepID=UPI00041F9B15|nr:SusC/RagA family TonB-linked outer membrane protein [Olivibacter sitiensis]